MTKIIKKSHCSLKKKSYIGGVIMSESLNIKINKNLNNKNMSIIGSALKELKSVGSCIDIDLGIVYPLNEDGTPDWDLPIELLDDEVSAEWVAALSDEDYEICKEFIEN